MRKYLLPTIITFFAVFVLAQAQAIPVLRPSQGGTGIGTSTGASAGDVLTVSSTVPFLFKLAPQTASGGGSITTSSPASANYFPFWATASTLTGTSTLKEVSGAIYLTGLAGASGCLSVDGTGKITTSTCSGGTGITTLNGLTANPQFFATSTDTNLGIGILSVSDTHTFTPIWIGTLADARITSAGTWNAKQNALTFPLAAASTTDSTSFPIGIASTTGLQATLSFPLTFASTTHITATTPLIITSGVLAMPTSTSVQNGFLLASDWTIFNNKQNNLTFPLALTSTTHPGYTFATSAVSGIYITSSSNTWTFALTTSSVSANSYTNTNLTVDAYGRITSASNGSAGSGSGVASTSPWTAGYLPYTTSTGGAITNSNIFQLGTNIGIGTTTPTFKLTIDDGIATTTHISFGDTDNPACSRYEDDDNGGFTYTFTRNGATLSTTTKPIWCDQF